MSYIDYINRFWKAARQANFSAANIALFFYILDCFNKSRWSSAVKVNSADILEFFGIHRNTLHDMLNSIDLFTDIAVDRKNGSKFIIFRLKPAIEKVQVDTSKIKPATKPAQQPAIEKVQVSSREDSINYINNIYKYKDFKTKDENEEKIKIENLVKKAQQMVNYN